MAGPLLSVLLPCHCALCGARGPALLCDACRRQFFGSLGPRCPMCANPLPPAVHASPARSLPPCGHCQSTRPAFDATVAAADYAMPVDRLVLQLKFAGRLAHARLFADLLAGAVHRSAGEAGAPLPALLAPVPLGAQRLAERGFNQALEIARPLARALGIELAPRLAERVLETAPQSSMAPGERRANIAQAFAIGHRAQVEGRHIGIVDDVMSSGQTLDELAATLKRHGAARVTNYVFARTPPNSP